MKREYIVEFKGDDSQLLKKLQEVEAGMHRLNDNEVIISLQYDGNIKDFNKKFSDVQKRIPSLDIQFQYNVNKELLKEQESKLKDLEDIKADIDTHTYEKKIKVMTSDLNKAFQSNALDTPQLKAGIDKLFAYINTASKITGKNLKNNLNFDDLDDIDEFLNGYVYNKAFENKKLSLFDLDNSNLEETIAETKSELESMKQILTDLTKLGAHDTTDNEQLKILEDKIRIINQNVAELRDQMNNVSGELFKSMQDDVDLLNGKLAITLSNIERLKNPNKYSIGETLKEWKEEGQDFWNEEEKFTPFSSQTNEVVTKYASGEANKVSIKDILAVIRNKDLANIQGVIDTLIHTHPEKYAAFSDADIVSAFSLLSEGISKQVVSAFEEIMTIDYSKVDENKQEEIVKLIKNSYKNIDNELGRGFLVDNLDNIKKNVSYLLDKQINKERKPQVAALLSEAKSKIEDIFSNVNNDENYTFDTMFEAVTGDLDKTLTTVLKDSDYYKRQSSSFKNELANHFGEIGNYIADTIKSQRTNTGIGDVQQQLYQDVLQQVFTNPKFLKEGIASAIKIEKLDDYIDRNSIVKAAQDTVETVREETAKAQKSSSPSKVAEKLGEYWGEGYAQGILNSADKVKNAIRALVETGKLTLQDLIDDENHSKESKSVLDAYMNDEIDLKSNIREPLVKSIGGEEVIYRVDEEVVDSIIKSRKELYSILDKLKSKDISKFTIDEISEIDEQLSKLFKKFNNYSLNKFFVDKDLELTPLKEAENLLLKIAETYNTNGFQEAENNLAESQRDYREELEKTNQVLEEQIEKNKQLEEELDIERGVSQSAADRYFESESKNDLLEKMNQSQADEIGHLQEENSQLEEENRDLQSQLSDAHSNFSDEYERNNELSNINANLEIENKKLKESIKELEKGQKELQRIGSNKSDISSGAEEDINSIKKLVEEYRILYKTLDNIDAKDTKSQSKIFDQMINIRDSLSLYENEKETISNILLNNAYDIENVAKIIKDLHNDNKLFADSVNSVDQINTKMLNGKKIREDAYEISEDIGLSEDEFLIKLQRENEEVKAGIRNFQERYALIKDGKVIQSFAGSEDRIGIYGNEVANEYDKAIHTHSPIDLKESITNGFPSSEDLKMFLSKYKEGVREFILYWDNNILKLKLPAFLQDDQLFFQRYENFTDSVLDLSDTKEEATKNGISGLLSQLDELGIKYQYINSLHKELVQESNETPVSSLDDNLQQTEQAAHNSANAFDEYTEALERNANASKEVSDLNVSSSELADMFDTSSQEKAIQANKEVAESVEKISETKIENKVQSDIQDLTADLDKLENAYEDVYAEQREFENIGSSAFEEINEDAKKATTTIEEYLNELRQVTGSNRPVGEVKNDTSSKKSKSKVSTEANKFKDVAEFAEKAALAKEHFVDANEQVQSITEGTIGKLKEEKELFEGIAQSAKDATKGKKDYNKVKDKKKKNEEKDSTPNESKTDKSDSSLTKDQKDAIKKQFQWQVEESKDLQKRYNAFENTLNKIEIKGSKASVAWYSDEDVKRVNEILGRVKQLKDIEIINFTEENELEAKKYLEQLKEIEKHGIDKTNKPGNANTQASLIAKIGTELKKNTGYSKDARKDLEAFFDELKNGGQASAQRLEEINQELKKIIGTEAAAGRGGDSFITGLGKRITSLTQSAIGMYFSFYDAIRYAQNAFETIRSLDTALVDLRKTTTMSNSDLEEFYLNSNNIAKQMGVTTEEIINQAASWSRLGYSSKEASETMAELSSQFASISPGMDTEKSQEGLVAIMKGFGVDVVDVEREIMDNVNAIGNTMALTNQDVVEMLERSSAAMSAANNSLQETIAVESAAMEITQNAETTGTAFRTISMRIRGKQSLPPYIVIYMLCA